MNLANNTNFLEKKKGGGIKKLGEVRGSHGVDYEECRHL